MKEKVIYDFGMNNGDDLPYYLKKGTKVVGVEANPKLCSLVEERFANNIKNGSLIIINCILSDKNTEEKAHFYIHKRKHALSQFPRPEDNQIHNFESIKLPQRTASSIIFEHGDPHYIKIDIEHFDQYLLREICEQNIRPNYISVEAHSFNVYYILKEMGYKFFNIVEGKEIATKYKNVTLIDRLDNKFIYSFPLHSAGPYGIDIINSPWMKAWQMDLYLKFIKPGWKDIHASFDDLSNNNFWWQMSFISKPFIKKTRQKLGLRTRLAKMFSLQ